jgi:hypothetical protein
VATTITYKQVAKGDIATPGPATAYTVPAATKARVKELLLCNRAGAARTVTLTIAGQTVASALSLPQGLPYPIALDTLMEAADTITWAASGASVAGLISVIELA